MLEEQLDKKKKEKKQRCHSSAQLLFIVMCESLYSENSITWTHTALLCPKSQALLGENRDMNELFVSGLLCTVCVFCNRLWCIVK